MVNGCSKLVKKSLKKMISHHQKFRIDRHKKLIMIRKVFQVSTYRRWVILTKKKRNSIKEKRIRFNSQLISLNGKRKPMTIYCLQKKHHSIFHRRAKFHHNASIKIYQMIKSWPLKKAYAWVTQATVCLMKKFQRQLITAIKRSQYKKSSNCEWKIWFTVIGLLTIFRKNGLHLNSIRFLVLACFCFLWFYLCFISFFGKI